MAARRSTPRSAPALDELPDGAAERAQHAVRSARAMPLTAVIRDAVGAKLSRRGQAALVEALERRGFERTSKGFRVPLAEQVREVVGRDGQMLLKGAKRALAGVSNDAEVKRAALELVRRGELVLGVTENGEVVAAADDRRWLSADEVAALKDVVKRLTDALKKTRAKKGHAAAVLERQWIADLSRGATGVGNTGDAEAVVLRTLGDLAAARGRSVFVPDLVVGVRERAPRATPAEVHAVLLRAAERGELELRPESGVGLLSAEEEALCVRARDGTVLSYVRPRGLITATV